MKRWLAISPERNIYRIDHYLGKETVQNLLVMRFANRFINAQWDSSCIDHVQITVAETVGIEGRWSYYDQVGQLRDMVQNHLMQLVCLVAMEPPNTMTAEDIRDEKIKIVRALRAIDESNVAESVVRGQYTAGWRQGSKTVGYNEEEGAASKPVIRKLLLRLKPTLIIGVGQGCLFTCVPVNVCRTRLRKLSSVTKACHTIFFLLVKISPTSW